MSLRFSYGLWSHADSNPDSLRFLRSSEMLGKNRGPSNQVNPWLSCPFFVQRPAILFSGHLCLADIGIDLWSSNRAAHWFLASQESGLWGEVQGFILDLEFGHFSTKKPIFAFSNIRAVLDQKMSADSDANAYTPASTQANSHCFPSGNFYQRYFVWTIHYIPDSGPNKTLPFLRLHAVYYGAPSKPSPFLSVRLSKPNLNPSSSPHVQHCHPVQVTITSQLNHEKWFFTSQVVFQDWSLTYQSEWSLKGKNQIVSFLCLNLQADSTAFKIKYNLAMAWKVLDCWLVPPNLISSHLLSFPSLLTLP